MNILMTLELKSGEKNYASCKGILGHIKQLKYINKHEIIFLLQSTGLPLTFSFTVGMNQSIGLSKL